MLKSKRHNYGVESVGNIQLSVIMPRFRGNSSNLGLKPVLKGCNMNRCMHGCVGGQWTSRSSGPGESRG